MVDLDAASDFMAAWPVPDVVCDAATPACAKQTTPAFVKQRARELRSAALALDEHRVCRADPANEAARRSRVVQLEDHQESRWSDRTRGHAEVWRRPK